MTLLGPRIIEDFLEINDTIKYRNTVRAILLNEQNEIGLLYSSLYDDYTFPGGGIAADESHIMALERELSEELGAKNITDVKLFGYIEELKYGLFKNEHIYLQTSYYYFCKIKKYSKPHFIEREMNQGLILKWVKIDDAINQNLKVLQDENHQQFGLKTALKRENQVLKKIKEFTYEKI